LKQSLGRPRFYFFIVRLLLRTVLDKDNTSRTICPEKGLLEGADTQARNLKSVNKFLKIYNEEERHGNSTSTHWARYGKGRAVPVKWDPIGKLLPNPESRLYFILDC
jgi:hypothetical protein